MKRIIPILCLLSCVATLAADDPGGGHRPWSDVEHWTEVFDDPARDEWQMPLTVVDFLGVEAGDIVADLGAGTGYFTKPLSIVVGPAGKVYAVDIEQAMLDHLMQRSDITTDRVIPVLASATDPKLPKGGIDLIVIVNTWHHVEKRSKYLRRLEKSLSPEGRIALVDFRAGELPIGPPPAHKLSRDQVVTELEDSGWRFVAESVALPYQYVLIFLPPEKERPGFLAD